MSMQDHALPGDAALCRFLTPEGEPHLGWLDLGQYATPQPPAVTDLTRVSVQGFTTVAQALTLPAPSMYVSPYCDLIDFVDMVSLDGPESWRRTTYPHGGHIDARSVVPMLSSFVPPPFVLPLAGLTLLAPIDSQKLWLIGGSDARGPEAGEMPRDSAEPHAAEPPFPFEEGDARHVVGPEQAIRTRSDAPRTVPGPALAVLLNGLGTIVGYTIANDVRATTCLGEGPSGLPGARFQHVACALGPWVVPPDFLGDPYALRVSCSIERGGAVSWQAEASMATLRPRLDEHVRRLAGAPGFAHGAYLLAGIPLTQAEPIALQAGDIVAVTIEGLGTLRNLLA